MWIVLYITYNCMLACLYLIFFFLLPKCKVISQVVNMKCLFFMGVVLWPLNLRPLLSWYVRNQIPSDTATHPGRKDTLFTLLREPENLHNSGSVTKILGTWLVDTFVFVNILCVCVCTRARACVHAVGLQ